MIGGGKHFRETATIIGNSENKQQAFPFVGSSKSDTNKSQQLLPVLVIIHGESFDYGSGSTINGLKFVQQNSLLVVTFNYRLNILGKYKRTTVLCSENNQLRKQKV